MAIGTLENIEVKVRQLTLSPSESQLSTDELRYTINTALLYDFPEILRLNNLHTTITFYTQPNVDTYDSTIITDPTNPLYDFLNRYITVDPPIYIAGREALLMQSRSAFYRQYPLFSTLAVLPVTGNGIQLTFTGQLTGPVVQGNITFSSMTATNASLVLRDVPVTTQLGNLIVPDDTSTIMGTINYITGTYSITFPSPPGPGVQITSQSITYNPQLPQAILFYDGVFTVRPVPDQAYPINIQAYRQPIELIEEDQTPELREWWQYIAYLAAKKIFESRMDLDSVQMILPELKNQELLCLRRTIVQNSNQSVQTIYSNQLNRRNQFAYPWGFGWPV